MQTAHSTVLNTLMRVQRFMDTSADALGALNESGSRRTLDDVVTSLSSHAVNQAASKRVGSAETAKQRVLRNALKVNHMRPIATVAKAQLKQVPEFLALKMPAANTTSRRLIAAAGAMAVAAKNYAKTFTDAGNPADFLQQLQTAASALDASLTDRGATTSTQSGATAGLKAETARGRDAVKVLDSLIEPQLAGDTVLLVQWKSAKRFGGKSTNVTSASIDAAAKGPSNGTAPKSSPTPSSEARDLTIHVILDNDATHTHPKVKRWLARHPRVHVHFTPTSASWLNVVERFSWRSPTRRGAAGTGSP
jgi:hypothetical protein